MADDPVHRVAIGGAALSSLVHTLAGGTSDCDGLLFGHVVRQKTSVLSDDEAPPEDIEERVANITGMICSGQLLSFYDAAGTVDSQRLEKLLSARGAVGDPPIGWFVSRRNTPLRPSMREVAVTASCSQRRASESSNSQLPFFLLLLTATLHEPGSTETYDYKILQSHVRSSVLCLEPRALKVLNIGPNFRGHYSSFAPISSFPHITSRGEASSPPGLNPWLRTGTLASRAARGNPDGQALLSRQVDAFTMESLEKVAGGGSNAQYLADLEALYGKMLSKLDNLARSLCDGAALVAKQEEENEALRRQLQKADI